MSLTELNKRPDPSLLLSQIEAEEQRRKRGKLKIFFGSSAGVGKTYAMLLEAQRKTREGVDVVAGIIETHERPETKQLLEGLKQLPRMEIDHRGIKIKEFDLDAALARKPAILLVDELAHTNAPGSRHPKRWKDVEELLAAGIDVYTTLNVQHLESLNDVVESVTGIPVRETVPDIVFDEAEDIVLVDTPPDELLSRLKDGKVYIAPGANERAVQNFFKKGNLLSLRELALRRAADYVDADTDDYRRQEGLSTPNTAGDRLMVCIGPDKYAAKLVRTTKRLASALRAPWSAVYVETAGEGVQDARIRQHVQQVLQSAERNGADVVMLQSSKIGDELLNYARNRGVTKIIIGKSPQSWWKFMFRANLPEFLISKSGDIDVYVVTTPAVLTQSFNKKKAAMPKIWLDDYVYSFMIAGFCTLFGYFLRDILTANDMIMIYMVGALAIAARLGRGPALVYSLISPGLLNYFFVAPLYTLQVYNSSYWLTFVVMFMACFVISSQASRLREQVLLSRQRERETQLFYSLNKSLTETQDGISMAKRLSNCIADAMQAQSTVWYPDDANLLVLSLGRENGDTFKERMVAQWCFDQGQVSGIGTDTMPGSSQYYLPIRGTKSILGVVGVTPPGADGLLLPDQMVMLETFVGLLASALERFQSAEAAERTKLLVEKEKLRNILLSSVSHDLRSPLAAITGAADVLLEEKSENPLLVSIRREAARLSRIINNLLDITRIEGGQIQLNMHPYYPAEIIGTAVEACGGVLKDHVLTLSVNDNLPIVKMDGLLISQVIQNLLENASRHTPLGTVIDISAEMLNGAFRLTVSDNGPGIPAGQEKEIFNKFATFTYGDKPKGTGLGLAICQAVMTAHGGLIWAENKQDNGGSRFIVELPSQLVMWDEY